MNSGSSPRNPGPFRHELNYDRMFTGSVRVRYSSCREVMRRRSRSRLHLQALPNAGVGLARHYASGADFFVEKLSEGAALSQRPSIRIL
jgi:hypothetical protein